MSTLAMEREYDHRYDFNIEIDDFEPGAAFSKCEGLGVQVAVIETREGGRKTPVKEAGRVTFPNITLTRGVTSSRAFYMWMQKVFNALTGTGRRAPDYKKNFDIVQRFRDGTQSKRYRVFGAFPVDFKPGDFDAEADESTIETLELAIDRWIEAPF